MTTYKKKIAYLTSLLVQIKEYSISKLEKLIDMDILENLLDLLEVSDRKWEYESLENQRAFSHFLNTHILERVVNELKQKKLTK